MAIRRVRCGSSVYVQKNASSWLAGCGSCAFSALTVKPRLEGFRGGMVAVVTEDRIVAVVQQLVKDEGDSLRNLTFVGKLMPWTLILACISPREVWGP